MALEVIDWTAGVPRGAWPTFAYASEHGDVVRGKVRGERAAQGLPRHVEVKIR